MRLVLLLGCWLAVLSLTAQQLPDQKYLKALAPRSIGPAGMSGRVTSIDVDLSDPDIIYAGTASGGVWKSTNGGITWQPIFDEQPLVNIGAVAVSQANPSVVWVGTGEGNPRNSHSSGEGIYRSLDGGKTWKLMGLEKTRNIHRIIVDPNDPNTVYVGAMGSIWGPNSERGVYRTRDGGKNWERVLYVNDSTGIADLVVDPTNPLKLIAAMWEFGRKPWTFTSGGKGSGLYVSYDGGDSWVERTEEHGLPKGDLGRIGLAIARNKPNIVYALVEAKVNGLYKSTDGGSTWKLVQDKDIGNRPFYYAEIYVDPQNENRIYNLFSLVTRSEDGGKTFEVLLPYSGVHPDHHAFWIHPDDPNYLIDGNDGGLNISRDGGKSWRFIDNLPLAQFYHINYDMEVPYNVGGGMQDNGSWVGPSQVWKSGGITNQDWQEVFFGDGFDVVFRPDNPRYVYAMSQGGNLGYVDRVTGETKFVKPMHPDGVELRFNWNAAIAQDPYDPATIYYGSQFVHKSTDRGRSWTIISPDLTTNDPEKQQQDKSGGLTIDATNAENHTTILAIAPSPVDRRTMWVGTDDGQLHLTRDGGKSWTNLSAKLSGVKAGFWIPYIEVSQKNAGEAFVVVNDYRRNDFRPTVFHTTNFGQNWKQIITDKDVTGPALSIVQDPLAPDLLWLGTDHGLYVSLDGGTDWTKWTQGYPSVSTIDMKIHPREHDLILGTFGRAAYILDDIRPIREIARTDGKVLDKSFAVFPAPDAYLAETRSYQGIRFAGDGTFQGQNRPDGAMLTVWVKPDKKAEAEPANPSAQAASRAANQAKAKAKPKATTATAAATTEDMASDTTAAKKEEKPNDKVKVRVLNTSGDTIRTFTQKLEPGMNRFGWNLRGDGVRFPSRREPRADEDLPAMATVTPGVYKLVMTYGKQVDSTIVTVRADPRLPDEPGRYAQREQMQRELSDITKAATQGFERLREARKTIDRVEGALSALPDSTLKQVKEKGKSLRDTIAELEKLYMTPDDLKGIQRDPNNLQGTLSMAMRYTSDVTGQPTQMATLSLEQARKQTREVLNRVNEFINDDFAAYRREIERMQYSLFKPLEPVEME